MSRNRNRGPRTQTTRDNSSRPDTFELVIRGEVVGSFRAAPHPPIWSYVEFAAAAADGITTEDVHGMAVLYNLVRAAVDERDWDAFNAAMRRHQPGTDDMLSLVEAAITVAANRPTARPGGSSGGPQTTGPTSTAGSSSPATPPPNRPDLAVVTELVPVAELSRTG